MPFPLIVVIVDELADLMGRGKEVEDAIIRFDKGTQGSAIMILATKRPSLTHFRSISGQCVRSLLRYHLGPTLVNHFDENGAVKNYSVVGTCS